MTEIIMHCIHRFIKINCLFLFLLSLLVINTDCLAATAQINWNDKTINWLGYNEGLAIAKRMKKPAIIVFY